MSTYSGSLHLWNWTTGKRIGQWKFNSRIRTIESAAFSQEDTETVFIHQQASYRDTIRDEVVVHNFKLKDGIMKKLDNKIIHHTTEGLKAFKVYLQGKVVLISYSNSLWIGERKTMQIPTVGEIVYTFRELTTTEPITCFDARIEIQESSAIYTKKGKIIQPAPYIVDAAIGLSDGRILLYEDVLQKLIAFENSSLDVNDRLERIFHWHRRPVGVVKWSLDGKSNHVVCTLSLRLT
jgi:hypothetical protein